MARPLKALFWALIAEHSEPNTVAKVTREDGVKFYGFLSARGRWISGGVSRLYGRFETEKDAAKALTQWRAIKDAHEQEIDAAKREVARLMTQRDAERDAMLERLSMPWTRPRPKYFESD
jgi:hypothetical protein